MVVTEASLEEAAAVDPRVDLVGRLVAMELVLSDMCERNNKRGSSRKSKGQQTTAEITAPTWVVREIQGLKEEKPGEENCKEKDPVLFERCCDSLLVGAMGEKKKLDGEIFPTQQLGTRVTSVTTDGVNLPYLEENFRLRRTAHPCSGPHST